MFFNLHDSESFTCLSLYKLWWRNCSYSVLKGFQKEYGMNFWNVRYVADMYAASKDVSYMRDVMLPREVSRKDKVLLKIVDFENLLDIYGRVSYQLKVDRCQHNVEFRDMQEKTRSLFRYVYDKSLC